jgi:hypothetical protein
MKTYSLLMLLLLCTSSSSAQRLVTEKEAVAYAKTIDVKTLDPSLSSQSLDDWLRSGPPHAELLVWVLAYTCDLKPDDSNTDYPLCVKIRIGRGGQFGEFLVEIGTDSKGIAGVPRLYSDIGVYERGFISTGQIGQLSDLPHLLDQPAVTGGVSDLYQRLVARQPMGIPKGADKEAVWPFLSRRLAQQLETAQACQDDYFRRHPKTGTVLKPGWLNSGLFVGDGKHAAPFYINPTRKEPQKDGSFWVYVDLTYDKAWVSRGKGFTPDQTWWRVIATVIPEDNRFVVDNVRLFDGLPTDGPSHLLSDSFVGCDDQRWVGVRSAIR